MHKIHHIHVNIPKENGKLEKTKRKPKSKQVKNLFL
jgi:hypothetical protein